jgi:hypothetical protein
VTRAIVNAPRWIVYGLFVVAALAAAGWIKPYLHGPDLSLSTVYRPRPVPVRVTEVKWLTKVEKQIVRERIEVEAIRELPPKQAERLEKDFQITLPSLRTEGRDLLGVLDIPRAPHGGEIAVTVNTTTARIDGIFRPKAAPFVELGGVREAGVDFDVLSKSAIGYYRQDLVRLGPCVVNAKVFATSASGRGPAVGAFIGVAVRF